MGESAEFFRDLKEAKKQRKFENDKNPPKRRCWDWIVVTGSCHYAKNRASFTTYRRIQAGIKEGIIGVGTVELQVRRSPTKGSGSTTLVLDNVLHRPSAYCNGFNFGLWVTEGTNVTFSADMVQGTVEQTKQNIWFAKDFHGYKRLVIAQDPKGESPLLELAGAATPLEMYLSKDEKEAILGKDLAKEAKTKSRCWDWLVVGGDCHYARDRSAFTTYREIEGTAMGAKVVGIGSVELRVEQSPKKGSGKSLLVLKNVLHVPGAVCNGFQSHIWMREFGCGASSSSDAEFVMGVDGNGKPMWYATKFSGLNRLVLAGNPKGDSPLAGDDSIKMMSVYMHSGEKSAIFGEADF